MSGRGALPPRERSRAALHLTAAAARSDGLVLQRCADCGVVSYPPRDGCPNCLSVRLRFEPVPDAGELIAQTTIRVTTDAYFCSRMPWRTGLVRLDCGPSVVAHLAAGLAAPSRVRLVLKLDAGGNAVMVAMPTTDHALQAADPLARELATGVAGRRILVTDGANAVGAAVAQALVAAGAAVVHLGLAPGAAAIRAPAGAEIVPLDLSDAASAQALAAGIGARLDIVVNTAGRAGAGGIVGGAGAEAARGLFERNVLDPIRLAQAFGPVLGGRATGAAFVDILSVYAFASLPSAGLQSASAAARLSLLQCLRAELRPAGVRVLGIFAGPINDEDHRDLPPPKVPPRQIAAAVVRALETGLEESFAGDIAEDVLARLRSDPKVLERELAR